MTFKHTFHIKPVSANDMFASQGRRRFKSNKYRAYQHHIQNELRDVEWPFESNQLIVSVDAGVSNRGADVDNVIKPILDTYQSVFDAFNDNKVYRIAHRAKDQRIPNYRRTQGINDIEALFIHHATTP